MAVLLALGCRVSVGGVLVGLFFVCFWCRVLKSHFCSLSRRYETISIFFLAFLVCCSVLLALGCRVSVGDVLVGLFFVCFWCRVLKSHFCSLSRKYATIAFVFFLFSCVAVLLALGCQVSVGGVLVGLLFFLVCVFGVEF